ncbi:hypothetical protein BH09SUM1_BH09SUM1_29110 [soil metagenome]
MRVTGLDEYALLEWTGDAEDFGSWKELQAIHAQFLFGVVAEADFTEWDRAILWCWQNFGPRHGECSALTEYANCPLIQATGYTGKDGMDGKERERKFFSGVDWHSHVGTWTDDFIAKTDYDHGYGEFCFSSEEDRAKFREAVPLFDDRINHPNPKISEKDTVERYLEARRHGNRAEILDCLSDHVTWVIPGRFSKTGKEAFIQEVEDGDFVGTPTIAVSRLLDQSWAVVADGKTRRTRKDGSVLYQAFCEIYLVDHRQKISHLTSYLMESKKHWEIEDAKSKSPTSQ